MYLITHPNYQLHSFQKYLTHNHSRKHDIVKRNLNIGFNAFIFFLPLQVVAINANYSTGITIGTYENIDLVSDPVDEETSQSVFGTLSVNEDTAKLFLNINGVVNAINYRNDIVEDRTTGSLIANIVWRIKPNQFEWYLDETFTQTLTDTLGSNTPSNRENINVLSTGPNYTIRINRRNNLELEARAENHNYERNFDNNRGFAAGRWVHNVNSGLRLSLNSEAELVRFKDEVVNNDFDRFDSFLSIDYERGITVLNAEYGTTNISNELLQDISVERYLVAISSLRSRSTTIRIDYENVLSDTGRQASNLTVISNDTPLSSATNDLFVDQTTRLQYMKRYSDSNVTYELLTGNRDYIRLTNLDVEIDGALIRGNWAINLRDNASFDFRYVKSLYLDSSIDRSDEDYRYSIAYNHRLRRQINIGLEMTSLERESNIESSSYDDLRLLITLNYTSP